IRIIRKCNQYPFCCLKNFRLNAFQRRQKYNTLISFSVKKEEVSKNGGYCYYYIVTLMIQLVWTVS
ncbi:MAG: hypothetical protein M3208_00660, partial [Thermoproteota archaeon]|nr:hypothetical protein [Thermoproteota archaeon]